MEMIHKMRIAWPDEHDKDKCIELLVENILARFPDAEVTSAPVETGNEEAGGFTSRWLEQTFTSPLFDMAADSAINLMLDELESMRDRLFDDSSPFDQSESEYLTVVMNSIIDHLSHKFLGEDCDHA
jgi:hypothetical protein